MMALWLLMACEDLTEIPLHFDGPVAAAVLPEHSTPFYDPVGAVANSRSGRILWLNLKEARFLTDDPMASFLPSRGAATGRARILQDLAVDTDGTTVTAWTIDASTATVLRVPYITGWDDSGPIEVEPTVTDPVFVDADGSGDSLKVTDVRVRSGYTTTEDWVLSYDGQRWWTEGTRSGLQEGEPKAGQMYRTDDGELELTLSGSATAGDRVELSTDSLLTEISFDGRPMAILAAGGRLWVSVAGEVGTVAVLDLSTGSLLGSVSLPSGAVPGRLAAATDGRIFVADGALSAVHVLRFDLEPELAAVAVESLATAGPIVDLAWVAGEAEDDSLFEHLFVAPLGAGRADIWNFATASWLDPNPITPEVEGVPLGAPVSGMAASIGTVWLQQPDENGARPRIPVVSIATQDGLLHSLEASTGCEVQDYEGPVGPTPYTDTSDEVIILDDQGESSSVTFWMDTDTGKQIVTSTCGGVTRTEDWTVTYDTATLSWEVEGTISGVQANRAREDERYISDTGAISFLLASGPLPPTAGDRFEFSTYDGLATILGTDEDEDGQVERPWEFPARPAAFQYSSGPTGGGWDPLNRREFMLLPVQNSDITVRVHLDDASGNVFWN